MTKLNTSEGDSKSFSLAKKVVRFFGLSKQSSSPFFQYLPLLSGVLFLLGLGIFGYFQFQRDSPASLANRSPVSFSETGNSDWCSSTLQANLNSAIFTDTLGADSLALLQAQDCGDKISLLSQADWQLGKDDYSLALGGGGQYLPLGATNVWTTTPDTNDPSGQSVLAIDTTGSTVALLANNQADVLPTVRLASTQACVTGAGTASDPYVMVESALCQPPPPTPTPTPTPTPALTPTPTPGAGTPSCEDGYHLSGNACRPDCNLLNCNNCSSPNFCSSCQTGYYLQDGRCLPNCDVANCVTCTMPNYCSVCAGEMVVVNGACRPAYQPTSQPTPTLTPTPTPALTPAPTPPEAVATINLPETDDSLPLLARLGGDENMLPDLYSLAKLAGLSDATLKSIQDFASRFLLPVLLLLGLPLSLVLAFFPLPRGKALPGTSVTVSQNNFLVATRFTNDQGNYYGFHLPEAEYVLEAQRENTTYKPALTLTNHSYHHNLAPNFEVADLNQPQVALPTTLFKLTNHLANAAGILFIITTLIALTYLTPLGIIAILSHAVWMSRRIILRPAQKHHD